MELRDPLLSDILTFSEYEIERNKPMPSFNHSAIQINLGSELRNLYKHQYRIVSELSLDLSAWPSVPDICLYPKRPLNLKQDIVTVTEPPLCAIEIISPTQSVDELRAKAEKYFLHGVQSCWIVLPSFANIYVFSSADDYEIFRSHDILQDTKLGISLPLQEVFE
jgi:Uma2 family endonuclease